MLEVELKFRMTAPAVAKELAERLKKLGATGAGTVGMEDRYLYEAGLRARGRSLRLRKTFVPGDTAAKPAFQLCYKGPGQSRTAKAREEIEVGVGDEAGQRTLLQLFRGLGYGDGPVVGKLRRSWKLSFEGLAVTVCHDEVGKAGDFLELEVMAPPEAHEGVGQALRRLAAQLGLDPADYEARGYADLVGWEPPAAAAAPAKEPAQEPAQAPAPAPAPAAPGTAPADMAVPALRFIGIVDRVHATLMTFQRAKPGDLAPARDTVEFHLRELAELRNLALAAATGGGRVLFRGDRDHGARAEARVVYEAADTPTFAAVTHSSPVDETVRGVAPPNLRWLADVLRQARAVTALWLAETPAAPDLTRVSALVRDLESAEASVRAEATWRAAVAVPRVGWGAGTVTLDAVWLDHVVGWMRSILDQVRVTPAFGVEPLRRDLEVVRGALAEALAGRSPPGMPHTPAVATVSLRPTVTFDARWLAREVDQLGRQWPGGDWSTERPGTGVAGQLWVLYEAAARAAEQRPLARTLLGDHGVTPVGLPWLGDLLGRIRTGLERWRGRSDAVMDLADEWLADVRLAEDALRSEIRARQERPADVGTAVPGGPA